MAEDFAHLSRIMQNSGRLQENCTCLFWKIYRSDGRARLEDDINLGVPVKRDVQGHEYYPLPLWYFEEERSRRDLIRTLV